MGGECFSDICDEDKGFRANEIPRMQEKGELNVEAEINRWNLQ